MRKHLTFLIAILLCYQAYSQDVEELMTRKYNRCSDIIYNSTFLIPGYFERNSMDTVAAIIKYWEKQCGMCEPLMRLKILLAINVDTLVEHLYSEAPIVKYLIDYREFIQHKNRTYDFGHYSWVSPINNSFNSFTKELALELKKENSGSKLNSFYLDFYSNDFEKIFDRLHEPMLATSQIKQAYDEEVNRYINLPEWHYSIYSGVWIPIGNISIIGNHPIIGFQGGLKCGKILIDGAIDFKFGKSPNNYLVQKNDSIYSTTHFFGGFIGIEPGYELIKHTSHEIDLLSGIGWDGFDALSIGDVNDPGRVTKSINALNLNLGIGYRKYFKNRSYIGIETRYNFVNYRNKNGTDLSGNTLAVRLKYGVSRNYYRDSNLERLDIIK